jgi:hypothetical protein
MEFLDGNAGLFPPFMNKPKATPPCLRERSPLTPVLFESPGRPVIYLLRTGNSRSAKDT